MAEFQFLINGELVTYDKYEDIPETFDHVIKFLPDNPEPAGEDGNHTDEQHEAMSVWNGRLQELMEKERASNM
jgi:hypothetical protein